MGWQRKEGCVVTCRDHQRFRPQQCAALWPCAWLTGRSRKAIMGVLASQLSVLSDKAANATMGLKQTWAALEGAALPRPRSLLPSRTAECQVCRSQNKLPSRSQASCPQPVTPMRCPLLSCHAPQSVMHWLQSCAPRPQRRGMEALPNNRHLAISARCSASAG